MLARLRNARHWTPRYIIDKLKWSAYQRKHPDTPWLTPQAIQILSTALLPTDAGIEWGSGRSTVWFSTRAKHLTSVEHHPQWYDRIKAQLAQKGASNVTYLQKSLDGQAYSPYVQIAHDFTDRSLNFALIDGELRRECLIAVMPKIALGGLLVLDNANWYIDHPSRSPDSRSGKGHLDDGWAHAVKQLSDWRMIWTSSGVTDTAIWFRFG
jgi:predicted O-methyltransferase YrrM